MDTQPRKARPNWLLTGAAILAYVVLLWFFLGVLAKTVLDGGTPEPIYWVIGIALLANSVMLSRFAFKSSEHQLRKYVLSWLSKL